MQIKDICMNQKNNCDELKVLKKITINSKSELTTLVNAKIDGLVKTVSSNNSSKPVPTQDDMMKKKRVLMVGDSLSRNLNISVLQNVTNMEVKRTEAFIVDKNDPKARYPEKNFMEIVPEELKKDRYSTLILQGGTNEVTNLDTTGNVGDKIESLKEEIKVATEKLFNIAEQSLANNPELENVVILKRIFRCDIQQNDPAQIKNKLSEFGNRVLDDMWLTKGCPKNIIIAHQPLECQGEAKSPDLANPQPKIMTVCI